MTVWLPEEPTSSTHKLEAVRSRSRELEELLGRVLELEEENGRLRAEVERPRGGARAAGEAGNAERPLSPVLEASGSPRRLMNLQSAAAAKLNEALLENEEVLEKNRELHEQIEKLRRAQLLDEDRRMEQESALQELTSRMKILEGEKCALKKDLRGFSSQKPPSRDDSPAQKPQQLSDEVSEQPEAEPRPRSPRSCKDLAHAVEASGQEAHIVDLQGDLSRLQLENKQLLGMCTELRAMFEAERQATEQARLEAELLQGKLASERVRRRVLRLATPRSLLRSSSSSCSKGTASQAPKDACDNASVSSDGSERDLLLGGDDWLPQEEPLEEEGAREWLHGPDDQLKSPRPLPLEQPEALTKAGLAEDAAEKHSWWDELIGSTVCCRRPPAAQRARFSHREDPV